MPGCEFNGVKTFAEWKPPNGREGLGKILKEGLDRSCNAVKDAIKMTLAFHPVARLVMRELLAANKIVIMALFATKIPAYYDELMSKKGGETHRCSPRPPVGLLSPSSCARSSRKCIMFGVLPRKQSRWELTPCRPMACSCMQQWRSFESFESSRQVTGTTTPSSIKTLSCICLRLVFPGRSLSRSLQRGAPRRHLTS